MKYTKFALFAVFLMLATQAHAQLVVREQGGNQLTVKSGGTIEIKSGGTLLLDSGATMTLSDSVSFATLGATTLQAGASGMAGNLKIYPTTAAKGDLKLTISDQTGNTEVGVNVAAMGQATVLTVPDPGASTANVILSKGTQTISGAITLSAAGTALAVTNNGTVGGTLGVTGVTTTGGLVSKTTNDLSPAFSTGITANPVSLTTYGTCTVAAVNGGTCIPLAGVASRTITVTDYDIIAAGSAATCTGIILEDTNGTPVVMSTIAAAALTSGTHNFRNTANNVLGVGFGAGSGLTIAKGVQIIKNGSDCGTTTAFNYAITYTIQ